MSTLATPARKPAAEALNPERTTISKNAARLISRTTWHLPRLESWLSIESAEYTAGRTTPHANAGSRVPSLKSVQPAVAHEDACVYLLPLEKENLRINMATRRQPELRKKRKGFECS